MADQRRAGIIQVQVQGVIFDAKGNWSYNLGGVKREAIIGADGVHGFKETIQVPFIEGAITDRGTLDLATLINGTNQTVTLSLANGKVITLRDGWWAADGTATTEEAEIQARWEGVAAVEVS